MRTKKKIHTIGYAVVEGGYAQNELLRHLLKQCPRSLVFGLVGMEVFAVVVGLYRLQKMEYALHVWYVIEVLVCGAKISKKVHRTMHTEVKCAGASEFSLSF